MSGFDLSDWLYPDALHGRQPQGVVRPSPLLGRVHAFIPCSGAGLIDLAINKQLTLNGSPSREVIGNGLGLRVSSGNNASVSTVGSRLSGDTPVAVCFSFRTLSNTVYQTILNLSFPNCARNVEFTPTNTSGYYFSVGNNWKSSNFPTAPGPDVGEIYNCVYLFPDGLDDIANYKNVFINGHKHLGSSTTMSPVGLSSAIKLGYHSTSSNQINAQIANIAVFENVSESFAQALSITPALMYAPASGPLPFFIGAGGGTTITCTVGGASATGVTAKLNRAIATGVGAASATGVTSAILQGQTIACGVGAASATGVTAALNKKIAATVGDAAASGATANLNIAISATIGDASASGVTATISVGSSTTITCSVGASSANGVPAKLNRAISAQVGNAVASGVAATVNSGVTITCSVGDASATGVTAAILAPTIVTCSVGNASAAGVTASIEQGIDVAIACSVGDAVAAGITAFLSRSVSTVPCNAFASGVTADVLFPTTIVCSVGFASATGVRCSFGQRDLTGITRIVQAYTNQKINVATTREKSAVAGTSRTTAISRHSH